jgi:hypothetical protein
MASATSARFHRWKRSVRGPCRRLVVELDRRRQVALRGIDLRTVQVDDRVADPDQRAAVTRRVVSLDDAAPDPRDHHLQRAVIVTHRSIRPDHNPGPSLSDLGHLHIHAALLLTGQFTCRDLGSSSCRTPDNRPVFVQ